jgi:hypothetical protein
VEEWRRAGRYTARERLHSPRTVENLCWISRTLVETQLKIPDELYRRRRGGGGAGCELVGGGRGAGVVNAEPSESCVYSPF